MLLDTRSSRIYRIKRRRDFLAAASANRKWAMPGMVVQVRKRRENESGGALIRVGFTTSKKVGNAVARNRARRRLRACADEIIPASAAAGLDIVLIGRTATLARSFEDLKADLVRCLKKLDALAPEAGSVH